MFWRFWGFVRLIIMASILQWVLVSFFVVRFMVSVISAGVRFFAVITGITGIDRWLASLVFRLISVAGSYPVRSVPSTMISSHCFAIWL